MSDDFEYPLWVYRAVFKQTAGGGGAIEVDFEATCRMKVLFGSMGPDDYAAGRAALVRSLDSANNITAYHFSKTIDNEFHSFPVADISVPVTTDGPQLEKKLVLGVGEKLNVRIAAAAQNEELTVFLKVLLMGMSPPDIVTSRSGGTVTTTTTYSKVV